MENLFKLLFFLAIAVVIMVLVLERFGSPISTEKQASWARWILPLCALLLVAQLVKHWLN